MKMEGKNESKHTPEIQLPYVTNELNSLWRSLRASKIGCEEDGQSTLWHQERIAEIEKAKEFIASAPALLEENTNLRAEVDRLTKEKSECIEVLEEIGDAYDNGYVFHKRIKKVKDLLTRIK